MPREERKSIVMRSVTKVLGRGKYSYYVLDKVSMTFDAAHQYVILGVPGSGKSTLLRALSGMQKIGRGVIDRRCRVMPPLGTAHVFAEGATGRQLCKVFAQLFQADAAEVIEFTKGFSGLGEYFDLDINYMPSDMRSRLSFGLGYAIPADFYLFDGLFGTGAPNSPFRLRCKAAFEERRKTAGTIFATRDLKSAPYYGDRGIIIHKAKLYHFNTVEEAIYNYHYMELEPKLGTLEYAEDLIEKGKAEEAREYLDESGLLNSGDPAAFEILARVAVQLGDDDLARQSATDALIADTQRSGPHLLLAQIASRQYDHHTAVQHAETFLTHQPDHREAQLMLARAYEGAGSFGQAAAIWRGLIDGGSNKLALQLAIRCEVKAANWQGALDLMETSPAFSRDPSLLELKVTVLRGLGRWSDLKAAIQAVKDQDVERGLLTLYKSILNVPPDVIVDLLECITPSDFQKKAASRQLLNIVTHLDRLALIARKDQDMETASKLVAASTRITVARGPSLAVIQ